MGSTVSDISLSYTQSGYTRFQVEVSHSELNKYQLIRGDDSAVVRARANAKAAEWDAMWAKRSAIDTKRAQREAAAQDVKEKKALAASCTADAISASDALRTILARTLSVDDTIDWSTLLDHSPYPVAQPSPPAPLALPKRESPPREPQMTDPEFKPAIGFLELFSKARRQLCQEAAHIAFEVSHAAWRTAVASIETEHQRRLAEHAEKVAEQEAAHTAAMEQWAKSEADYLEQQRLANEAVDIKRQQYQAGDPEAVADYCNMVLDKSEYPDWFPKDFQLEYNPSNGICVVEYQLPSPSDIPTLAEVKYVVSRDEFTEKHLSDRQTNQLYDEMLYQVALRTIHELFEADAIGALQGIAFNGWVRSVDKATGLATEGCVLTVQVTRDEFICLDLSQVEPKACFKKLRGVAAAKLHALTPVAPLLALSREDRRFVSSYDVTSRLDDSYNLAAMDWEEFEHLIRELFECEFATTGGEVRVTQASRDGGVDAVIFDPDPLRGGKTVIQAKRYTNTVSVSAVRDLFGTMMNEGANKGILVTTSDYGPDAYEFAKGKPLVLLNGGNLLHLLATHGHHARIDLVEAKAILGDQERTR